MTALTDFSPPVHAYLARRVEISPGGCWLWKLSVNHKGYARCTPPGSAHTRRGHRWTYEIVRGPIPAGLHLDHLCRVRRCINPDHLEPVTNRDNSLRSPLTVISRNLAKTHCVNGHPFDESNTYFRGNGWRACRACQRSRNHRRKKAAA